jgi:hypothetical protein
LRFHTAVALAMALACVPSVVQGQVGNPRDRDQPPRPIEELAAEFARDPISRDGLRLVGRCPEDGSWRRALLRLLLENPPSSRQASGLVNSQSNNVQHCDIPELDAWFRQALASTPSNYSARLVVAALWKSGREDNRSAVLAALFDSAMDYQRREEMGDQLAGIAPLGIGPEAALGVFAEGYRQTGTAPPPVPTMMALRRVGGDEAGMAVKRTLLEAWESRPAAPGSLFMLSLLWDDAFTDVRLRGGEPTGWSRAVEAVMERVARGELEVPKEVRRYAVDRLPALRR